MERLFDRVAPGLTPGPVSEEEVYASLELPPGVQAGDTARLTRPYTVINMVMTVDGKTVVGGPRTTALIGSPADHRLMARITRHADAVLMGANLVRIDDPPYPRLSDDQLRQRVAAGLLRYPIYGIVTGHVRLPAEVRALSGPPGTGVIFTTARAPNSLPDSWRGRARLVVAGEERVEPERLARVLAEDLGVRRLVCLGGAVLNATLLEAGLVDELFVTIAPKLHAGSGLASVAEGRGWPAESMPRLELVSAYHHEGELYLRYRIPAEARREN